MKQVARDIKGKAIDFDGTGRAADGAALFNHERLVYPGVEVIGGGESRKATAQDERARTTFQCPPWRAMRPQTRR